MSTNLELKLPRRPEPALEPMLQIRYGQVGMVQVRIRTLDSGTILDELTGRVATAPRFFQRTAACLDLGALDEAPRMSDMRAVIDAVRRAGMIVIALAGGTPDVEALSAELGLPVLTNFRAQNPAVPIVQPAQTEQGMPAAQTVTAPLPTPATPVAQSSEPVSAPAAASAESAPAQSDPAVPAVIHAQPVRSGQRVHARGRDLVVTASVGPGAELLADGCVHVYGALRGRAMAGARGDTGARVFCQEFYAELISIAGVFKVFEIIPPEFAGKPVQAWLADDDLHLARIGG